MFVYYLERSDRKDKKYKMTTPDGYVFHFGAKGYEDYTIHKDMYRKRSYIARHQVNEDWTINGINTAGFWSYWLLWNKKTLNRSISDVEDNFNIIIDYDDN